MLSVIGPDTFNEVSHFMGTNPMIQYALQPVLLFGVLFHLFMGINLELKKQSGKTNQICTQQARRKLLMDESKHGHYWNYGDVIFGASLL